MKVTGLVVNEKNPSFLEKEQNNIRAAVHNCECLAKDNQPSSIYKKLWEIASGKVGTLTRFHTRKGAKQKENKYSHADETGDKLIKNF